jgi:hypothetical protein
MMNKLGVYKFSLELLDADGVNIPHGGDRESWIADVIGKLIVRSFCS